MPEKQKKAQRESILMTTIVQEWNLVQTARSSSNLNLGTLQHHGFGSGLFLGTVTILFQLMK